MARLADLLPGQPKSLDERYFSEIRPKLYQHHGKHAQHGTRRGRSLAEHLDSACQFVLTVSKIAGVPEDKRSQILAATAVHDLNKFDEKGRNVKTLARDRTFLREQLDRAYVADLVKNDADLERVRRLIERHSDHNVSDGMRFLPEDPEIDRWSAMVVAADLFDLGIDDNLRIRKVENKLTIALQRPCRLFRISLAEDRGYFTSLLLSACEKVLCDRGLTTLAIEPNGQIFLGETFPEADIAPDIARHWQKQIDRTFGSNVKQLVKPSKDGIKIDTQAVQQNPDAALDAVDELLVKKASSYKADKVRETIEKYGNDAGEDALTAAAQLGLQPVSNAEEFAISEGLKSLYLSYREAEINPKEAWNRIAEQVGISPEQRTALEPFNPQYGRGLFAAKVVSGGLPTIYEALKESFQLRTTDEVEASQELIDAVRQLLNFPTTKPLPGIQELTAYIDANPRKRCSLGTTSNQIEELISSKMPPETKVQAFSNRLPGGMSAEPKRRGDTLSALAYQLMAVGANFPKSVKQEPVYLHFALPSGSNVELRRIWREFLKKTAQINEDGTVTVDELELYRKNETIFKANKVVGFAFPKRPDFVNSTVTIPVLWGDVNNSVALLKSLRLALELSLSFEMGFPFILSSNLEIKPTWNDFGQVEGIPSSLQPLLGSGQYLRDGHLAEKERQKTLTAEDVLERLRCVGELAISVASLQKKDDCLYDLARATTRPLNLYYVLLRWVLREQDDPNLEAVWRRIREPLHQLLENLMSDEHTRISDYLKQAAKIAETGKLRGSSFRRTAQSEPFSEFIKAVRSKKSHMDWDTVFAALVQQYHTRLDRIREHGVGATKYEQVKQFYEVLKKLFEEVYNSRPERLLTDSKTLEAAYLFFLQEARQELKAKNEESSEVQPEAK
ncbi:CRISPR-associated protein Csc3 [Oxynema aestuarii]|uniref:CRISPR-associated protein Csc3 n=1 Tax=Oxynema aestuarii AP17 TaxID=2064643 RepID=A0A6H1TX43_9CYAN|nr:CRISPR-associated protein Csc3 [Oxynema aestuarii]QIZ69929.1 CRISPR-associated protein Csc3 [Oxynema aestuarii AP17]